jgi:trypsin
MQPLRSIIHMSSLTLIAFALVPQVQSAETQIVGGAPMSPTESPYLVGLRASPSAVSECGGALIAPTWVLTAAHCPDEADFVAIGTRYVRGVADGERIEVKARHRHPKYNWDTNAYDFMLLELKTPSKYEPISLLRPDDLKTIARPGAIVTTMGWGATQNATASNERLKVNLRLWGNTQQCFTALKVSMENDTTLSPDDRAYFTKVLNSKQVLNSTVCAGGEAGKDVCYGDSGGPLVQRSARNRTDVLIGVVSQGIGCGVKGRPGLYARVSAAWDFIYRYIPSLDPSKPSAPPMTIPPPAPPVRPSLPPAPTVRPSVPM